MTGKLKDLMRLAGGEWVISFTTRNDPRKLFDQLGDSEVDVNIKKSSPPRSKDANAFMWSMCSEIGKAMIPPLSKEMIYRQAIRDVGEYEPLPIKNEAVETFCERWASKGTGWFAEVIDDSKIKGYKLVFAYYGSSIYSSQEMSRLIEYLKQDMEEMGIPLRLSKEDEERMLSEWQRVSSRKEKSATSAAS